MNLSVETVGDLVAADFRKAEVFKRHGIDFCCGGGRTVAAACEKKGVPLTQIEAELLQAEQKSIKNEPLQFSDWDSRKLVDYIIQTHHRYVQDNIPLLTEFTAKVAKVHGHAEPELVEIAELFVEMAAELDSHMMKEEQILFPYIKQLAAMSENGGVENPPPFGTVQNPIQMMEQEHEHAGDLLAKIRLLSNDFTPPEHACTTYRVTYSKLAEFESDLHMHIHLENNILFPKAIKAEQACRL